MSLEVLIEILKAVFSGRTGPIEAVQSNPLLILIPFIMALISIGTYLVKMPGGPRTGGAVFSFGVAGLLTLPLIYGPIAQLVPPPLPPPSPGSTSSGGTSTRPLQPRFDYHRDHTLVTRQLRPANPMPGQLDCEKACAGEQACKAFVFDLKLKSCSLRMEAGKPMPFKDSLVGIKI